MSIGSKSSWGKTTACRGQIQGQTSRMTDHRKDFQLWYVGTLEKLYQEKHAGFPILMISLPLLERYLREKSGTHEEMLKPEFYAELVNVLEALRDDTAKNQTARDFWQVCRNGLLHQVTLSQKQQKDRAIDLRAGWIKRNAPMVPIEVTPTEFIVDPVSFSQKVISTIEQHFETFEGCGSPSHGLPQDKDGSTICARPASPNFQ
jgi:hypothetical protein